MDDIQLSTSAWLTFSLAFPSATALCQHMRNANPDAATTGNLIRQYIADQEEKGLPDALEDHSSCPDLQDLFSEATHIQVAKALEWEASSEKHHILGLDHPDYPALLRDTPDAPPLLYANGSLEALNLPLLAVVGSRKASHAAINHTKTTCAELAELGLGIVSGLALGIDAAAHEGALQANGITIAIAATAPNRVYPRRHHELANRILSSGGLILTEYPLNTATKPWFFPQRNRIISGLCQGVLIAEAGLPSGTLTTATHAMHQGREVMAVPGSVHNLQARGCHALIKQGAALVENTQDILDTLGDPLRRSLTEIEQLTPDSPSDSTPAKPNQRQFELNLHDPSLTTLDKQLLQWLSRQTATLDELMTFSENSEQKLTISQLSSALGLLEIRGLVTTSAGGRYTPC